MGEIKTLDEAWAVIKRDYQRIRELEVENEHLRKTAQSAVGRAEAEIRRAEKAEAEVERLKAALVAAERRESVVNRMADEWARKGGGRESGANRATERAAASIGPETEHAAAYPAARCDACWEGRSHTHAARKEASP